MTKSNTSIIDALNVTIEPELDQIMMDMADLQFGFGSYGKAVEWIAKKHTYEQLLKLQDAYKVLWESVQDAAQLSKEMASADPFDTTAL